MTTTTTPKKRKSKAKKKPITNRPPKRFNHDISLFSGELGLTKDDMTVMSNLLYLIASNEVQRVAIFDSKECSTPTSNLYRVKYKIETALHGKSA